MCGGVANVAQNVWRELALDQSYLHMEILYLKLCFLVNSCHVFPSMRSHAQITTKETSLNLDYLFIILPTWDWSRWLILQSSHGPLLIVQIDWYMYTDKIKRSLK